MEQSDYPPLYVTANRASHWGQRWHRRIISANLVLVIVGAVFSYIADAGDGTLRVVMASLAAIFLITGMLPRKLHNRVRDDKHWFEGRAIAETVKSLTWRYMMRVPPFADDADADAALVSSLNEIRDDVTGVESITTATIDTDQITPRMREIRSLDLIARRDVYDRDRLSDQVSWYRQRSAANRQRGQLWSRVNVTSELAAIAAAIGVIFSPVPWVNAVGVFAAVSVAATAWTQLGQHSLLTRSYALAATELERIQSLARAATTDDELRNAVLYGEGAISREHTLWTAKRSDTLAPVV
jgi:hypothetical protein